MMKVAVCYSSRIPREYSGRGSPRSLGRANLLTGIQRDVLQTIVTNDGMRVASPSTACAVSPWLGLPRQFHPTVSQVALAKFVPVIKDAPSLIDWASNFQTRGASVDCSWDSYRTATGSAVFKRKCSMLSLWKQGNVGLMPGRTKTNRKINGVSFPDRPIVRCCVAFSGEDTVAMRHPGTGISDGSVYGPFVNFAVQELSKRADVSPLLLKEEFRNMTGKDMISTIDNLAFTSPKIRLFRIACIQTGSSMQVLNVAGFARPEYDLPIFCADFFTVPNRNIIVLDLNPLFNTNTDKEYKERYFTELIPLANKYAELLPWGDKLTFESLQFFSPLVVWTKAQNQDLHASLFSAFQDYLKAWLKMVDLAHPTIDSVTIAKNREAQHRYISWRVTKDPGRPLLTKLYGEQLSERYIEEFLFSGMRTLGTKTFLDYFPEYRSPDGGIYKQRSMLGKSFEKRPWDKYGRFSPN